MKKCKTISMTVLLAAGAGATPGLLLADEHGRDSMEPATPVELFSCTFNEGKGYEDLEEVIEDWNDWADDEDFEDYSAWTLRPYYSGPEQEFDVLWLGGARSGAALGRGQDAWLSEGGDVAEDFASVISCDAHLAFAVMTFKEPPERDNPDNLVITFSDCSLGDSTSFNDLIPSIKEWAAYRAEQGSPAGMWSFMPAFGGGAEAFDFKWVTAYQNLEDLGKDFDQYSAAGWKKAGELFPGKVSCDSSRVYLATNHRRAESD
jgi:hypothetical protein